METKCHHLPAGGKQHIHLLFIKKQYLQLASSEDFKWLKKKKKASRVQNCTSQLEKKTQNPKTKIITNSMQQRCMCRRVTTASLSGSSRPRATPPGQSLLPFSEPQHCVHQEPFCTQRHCLMHTALPLHAPRSAHAVRGLSWHISCVRQASINQTKTLKTGTSSTHCALWSSKSRSLHRQLLQELKWCSIYCEQR